MLTARTFKYVSCSRIEDKKSLFVVPETKIDKENVFTIAEKGEMNSLKLIRDYLLLWLRDFIQKEDFSHP